MASEEKIVQVQTMSQVHGIVEQMRAALGMQTYHIHRADAGLYLAGTSTEKNPSFGAYFEQIEHEVTAAFKYAKALGKKARAWEIAGVANAASLGADETHCFAQATPPFFSSSDAHTFTKGDLFRTHEFKAFADNPEHADPAVIFCMAVGGMPPPVRDEALVDAATEILFEDLKIAFDKLMPGGIMLIQDPLASEPRTKEELDAFEERRRALLILARRFVNFKGSIQEAPGTIPLYVIRKARER